jgi:hypothetical protein
VKLGAGPSLGVGPGQPKKTGHIDARIVWFQRIANFRFQGLDPSFIRCYGRTMTIQAHAARVRRRRFQRGSLQKRKSGGSWHWIAFWWEDRRRHSQLLGLYSEMSRPEALAAMGKLPVVVNDVSRRSKVRDRNAAAPPSQPNSYIKDNLKRSAKWRLKEHVC